MKRQATRYAILLTVLTALVFQIMPLASQLDVYRPNWVLIVLSYWTMALPHRSNVGVAFSTGLVLDLLMGSVLGVHSFALAICIYILAANYQRLRNYSVWQQAIIIGLLSALYHLLLFWVQHLLVEVQFMTAYLWPVISSMVLWPWIFWLLRKLRRQLHIT